MKEIIYNNDDLLDSDINDVVIRVKALMIKDGNLLFGNESGVFQFIGGHLEDNETLEEGLIREIKEESGIDISLDEINKPFMKIAYLNKDYPNKGINRKNEIYYYEINTNKDVDLSKTNLTFSEKSKNYKVEVIPMDNAIEAIKNNINDKNEVVSRDMILAIEEYFKQKS